MLRTVALLRGGDVKARKLIGLEAKDFEFDWYRAVEAIELAYAL